MAETNEVALVYATFPDMETAKRVGRALVQDRVAACINIIPQMVSVYRWQDEIETADEVVMIIKTHGNRAEQVIEQARYHHPYDTPALLVMPVTGGLDAYVSWLQSETEQQPKDVG